MAARLMSTDGKALSLDKDAPVPRRIQPPDAGAIVDVAHVGGVQHHYERRAA